LFEKDYFLFLVGTFFRKVIMTVIVCKMIFHLGMVLSMFLKKIRQEFPPFPLIITRKKATANIPNMLMNTLMVKLHISYQSFL